MKIKRYTSSGIGYTDSRIKQKLSEHYRLFDCFNYNPVCECCQKAKANDHDHTIAQARCKVIHKVELIWNRDNWVYSCRKCHQEWESYKDGKWLDHKNAAHRMMFMKMHDTEGYNKRINLTST